MCSERGHVASARRTTHFARTALHVLGAPALVSAGRPSPSGIVGLVWCLVLMPLRPGLQWLNNTMPAMGAVRRSSAMPCYAERPELRSDRDRDLPAYSYAVASGEFRGFARLQPMRCPRLSGRPGWTGHDRAPLSLTPVSRMFCVSETDDRLPSHFTLRAATELRSHGRRGPLITKVNGPDRARQQPPPHGRAAGRRGTGTWRLCYCYVQKAADDKQQHERSA